MNSQGRDGNGLYCNDSLLEGQGFTDHQQEQLQDLYADYMPFYDDPNLCMYSPLRFSTQRGIPDVEPLKKNEHSSSLGSLELLKSYGKGFKRLNTDRTVKTSDIIPCTKLAGKELSAEEIVRIAGDRIIRSCNSEIDVISVLENSFHESFSGLSAEETDNVKLAEFLLAAAEKVGSRQFDHAGRLLELCDHSSSKDGNPVQRIVYYFSEALRRRIDREMGKITSKGCGKSQLLSIDNLVIIPNSTIQACHEEIPFYQAAHLTGIQAIIENMGDAKRIHVIDLKIRNGLQWTVLMQALAGRVGCPLELLKITAVETTSKHLTSDTGKRLTSFALAMKIPFYFSVVPVPDISDLKADLFEIDAKEATAVYSEYALMNLIVLQDQLATIMRVISYIKPRILVVIESEANHNSPVFANRFIEAVFYFSAYFDCIDASMACDNPHRMIVESLFLGEGIRNIVAAEGEERYIRNVKLSVWRNFFTEFYLEEKEQSESAVYQANLAVRKFACGKFCTLNKDGKSLIFGWKGTPILSLSTWKFMC